MPVVVPTQFSLAGPGEVLLHLARPNPIWTALAENPVVLLSLAGDWAYVPAAWKAIGGEDPRLGIPTTYYAAVQLVARAQPVDDREGKAEILRAQLADLELAADVADPRWPSCGGEPPQLTTTPGRTEPARRASQEVWVRGGPAS